MGWVAIGIGWSEQEHMRASIQIFRDRVGKLFRYEQ